MKTSIIPLQQGWAHKFLEANYKAGNPVWNEVSEEFYHDMLNVLPPLDWNGTSFLVSEPYTHIQGDEVYCGLIEINKRYFARYVPRKQFSLMILELRTLLIQ